MATKKLITIAENTYDEHLLVVQKQKKKTQCLNIYISNQESCAPSTKLLILHHGDSRSIAVSGQLPIYPPLTQHQSIDNKLGLRVS